jgi:hypothetical protein
MYMYMGDSGKGGGMRSADHGHGSEVWVRQQGVGAAARSDSKVWVISVSNVMEGRLNVQPRRTRHALYAEWTLSAARGHLTPFGLPGFGV